MKIEAVPSPNFNDRKSPIDMLVLHYTGMQTAQDALARMCDPEAQVSAHYMVWEDGRIAQLVGEDKRAWHAGVSRWQGDDDLNSRSIGIEIVNGGHDWPLPDGSLPPYPEAQIEALIALCTGILQRWTIPQSRIVGHSDIAPARKEDPGEHFPWNRLAQAGIGLWPKSDNSAEMPDMSREQLVSYLSQIGYAVESNSPDHVVKDALRAFQRRWVPGTVTGDADIATCHQLQRVHALYQD